MSEGSPLHIPLIFATQDTLTWTRTFRVCSKWVRSKSEAQSTKQAVVNCFYTKTQGLAVLWILHQLVILCCQLHHAKGIACLLSRIIWPVHDVHIAQWEHHWQRQRCSQAGGFQHQLQSTPAVLNCSEPGALKCQHLSIIEESSGKDKKPLLCWPNAEGWGWEF